VCSVGWRECGRWSYARVLSHALGPVESSFQEEKAKGKQEGQIVHAHHLPLRVVAPTVCTHREVCHYRVGGHTGRGGLKDKGLASLALLPFHLNEHDALEPMAHEEGYETPRSPGRGASECEYITLPESSEGCSSFLL